MSLLRLCASLVLVAAIAYAEDLAAGKLVYQSSDFSFAGYAVDENLNTCSETKAGNFPWLLIDLGEKYHVTGVQLTNGAAASSRVFIKLGNEFNSDDLSTVDRHNFKKVAEMNDLRPTETRSAMATDTQVRKLAGRYLLITLKDRNEALSLCDIKVIGAKTANYALSQAAFQSSTIGKIVSDGMAQGAANRSVDGKRLVKFSRNSCSHTKDEDSPWWVVDLGAKSRVFDITITNRNDKCKDCWKRLCDFDIMIGDDFHPSMQGDKFNCMSYDFSANGFGIIATVEGTLGQGTHTLDTKRSTGRYLVIRKKIKGILTLCEVEIEATRV